MKAKQIIIGSLLALLISIPIGINAQNQPSSKVTAKTAHTVLLPKTSSTGGWQTVLANTIKTANQKDLFVNVSLEVGLFTQTKIDSKNLTPGTSVGQAQVDVRVLLDGNPVEPGVITFGRRSQTLSATLEGAIGQCLVTVTNPDGSLSTTVNLDCVTPETIELIQDSTDAAAFSFVAVNVSQGVHTVSVQARIDTIGSAQNGSYSALGMVGKGTVTVESVRLIKDAQVPLDVP
jgi:hypothetical protein